MSRLFPAREIASIVIKLFVAAGAGESESRIATESLITSSLMGHDSHGVCFILVDSGAFVPLDQFRRLIDGTIAYMKSSPPAPGFEEVLVPGELEFRTFRQREQHGIPVDDATLAAMRDHAERLRVKFNIGSLPL